MAIWQARESNVRSCIVHLDRIADRIFIGRQPAPSIAEMGAEMVVSLAGDEVRAGAQAPWGLESFTLAGRLLMLSALVFAAAVFYMSVIGLAYFMGIRWFLVSGASAAVAAALYMRLGIFMFRRFGIPFRITHPRRGPKSEG